MPIRNPPTSNVTGPVKSNIANVRPTNTSANASRSLRNPAVPTNAASSQSTNRERERTLTRAPTSVNTESSSRRPRVGMLSTRRRTSLATSSTSRRSGAAIEENVASSTENDSRRVSLSTYVPLFSNPRDPSPGIRRIRSRHKVSFSVANLGDDPVSRVLDSEKYLPKILSFFNWNELLPIRSTCKKWLEVVTSDPAMMNKTGVITIRSPWNGKLEVFNESPVVWTKFRILTNMFIDLMDTVQLEFWMKHGPTMRFLEIRNGSMTLSGLVEILSRCPNLEHFLVSWTPEMYSFNSELIKKYYGINFYNGNFASMHSLVVEKSSYLTDSGLWSMLKWCGGPLKSLVLTYPSEDQQDPLTRLKPRWTIQPLKNYFERFGYTGNLQYLNFSWSNLSPDDLIALSQIVQLSSLKAITLSHCKLNDDSLIQFLNYKGKTLEKLKIDNVPITDAIFTHSVLPHLKSLDISGKTNFQNLNFLSDLNSLEEFSAAGTSWLEYEMLMKPLKGKTSQNTFLKVDISGSIKINGTKNMDSNMNRVWFSNLSSTLTKVVNLDLSHWGQFGKNENFRVICQTMPLLEELRLRGWKDLSDPGITGLPAEKLHQNNILIVSKEHKNRIYVGSLKNLRVLDLSGSNISDASVKFGVHFVPYLRKFAFENTQISDIGVKYIINKNKTIDKISIAGCEKVVTNKPKFQRSDGRYIYVGKI